MKYKPLGTPPWLAMVKLVAQICQSFGSNSCQLPCQILFAHKQEIVALPGQVHTELLPGQGGHDAYMRQTKGLQYHTVMIQLNYGDRIVMCMSYSGNSLAK